MRFLFFLAPLVWGAFFFSTSSQAKTEAQVDSKKICDQTQGQIREQEAKKKKIGEERTQLEGQFTQSQQKYQDAQSRLQGQAHCSHGNPGNSPECENILSTMRQSTAEMDRIQQQIDKFSPDMLEINVELDKAKQLINIYQCR